MDFICEQGQRQKIIFDSHLVIMTIDSTIGVHSPEKRI